MREGLKLNRVPDLADKLLMNAIFAGCAGILAAFLLLFALHQLRWTSIDPMLAARDLGSIIRHLVSCWF